jgi:hypothetical protein
MISPSRLRTIRGGYDRKESNGEKMNADISLCE